MAMRYPKAPAPHLAAMPDDLAIDHMRDGGVLVHMHGKASEKQWFVVPGGPVTDATADRILKRPDVIGQRDGLFPGHDQTWRLVGTAATEMGGAA
jgi:hypothetical protein